MKTTIRVFEVEADGDHAAVMAALEPLRGLMGAVYGSLVALVSREVEVFLAAHGFTPADYYRTRIGAEDVEAFVARREMEQAGLKFTRTAPGAERPIATAEDVRRAYTKQGKRAPAKVPSGMVGNLARNAERKARKADRS